MTSKRTAAKQAPVADEDATDTTPLGQEAEKLIASGQADALTGEVMPFGATTLPSAASLGVAARFSDVIPSPEAWQEFEQVDIDDVLDVDLIIEDAMFLDSQISDGDVWAIIKFTDPRSGGTFTTATGAALILSRLRKVMHWQQNGRETNLLPMAGRITKTPSKTRGHSAYYNII